MSEFWIPEENTDTLGDLAFIDYADLLPALQKDLQLNASTDLLPNSVAEAVIGSGDQGWTDIAPNSPYTAGAATPRYMKDGLGWVHLDGRINVNGVASASAVVFTLPAGYRPGTSGSTFPAAGYNGTSTPTAAFLNFDPSTGRAYLYYSSGTADVGMSGLSFHAEQ